MLRKVSLVFVLCVLASLSVEAQDKVEVFGGYSCLHFHYSPSTNLNGWEISGQYKFTDWLGGVADIDRHYGSRRGLASNLYALGAQDKIVQRILRHSRPHVTRHCYIKVFDHTVLQAMQKLEAALERADRNLYQLRFEFAQT